MPKSDVTGKVQLDFELGPLKLKHWFIVSRDPGYSLIIGDDCMGQLDFLIQYPQRWLWLKDERGKWSQLTTSVAYRKFDDTAFYGTKSPFMTKSQLAARNMRTAGPCPM